MKRNTQKKKLPVNKMTICTLNNAEIIAAQGGKYCPPPTINPETGCNTDYTCPDTSDITRTVM
jgi:hypothetical protein